MRPYHYTGYEPSKKDKQEPPLSLVGCFVKILAIISLLCGMLLAVFLTILLVHLMMEAI